MRRARSRGDFAKQRRGPKRTDNAASWQDPQVSTFLFHVSLPISLPPHSPLTRGVEAAPVPMSHAVILVVMRITS